MPRIRSYGKRRLTNRQLRAIHAKSRCSSRKIIIRSNAAKKGWDTRTRKEGVKQLASGVVDLTSPAFSQLISVKDIGLGTAKILAPRKVRKSRTAKSMDVI